MRLLLDVMLSLGILVSNVPILVLLFWVILFFEKPKKVILEYKEINGIKEFGDKKDKKDKGWFILSIITFVVAAVVIVMLVSLV